MGEDAIGTRDRVCLGSESTATTTAEYGYLLAVAFIPGGRRNLTRSSPQLGFNSRPPAATTCTPPCMASDEQGGNAHVLLLPTHAVLQIEHDGELMSNRGLRF